ncbi:flagellar motor switch protein FliG [Candidatus Magnetomoraceae bacterium gMMP-15]
MSLNLTNGTRLTGPMKTAIFLMIMGEEYTTEFFKKLSNIEIKKLAGLMSEINYVPPEALNQVMEEFLDSVQSDDQLMIEGESFLKNVIDNSLEADKAQALYDELEEDKKNVPFVYFDRMDMKMMVDFIKGEHPQTIALILSHLKSSKAAAVLMGLPKNIQGSIAMRIAKMKQVPLEVVKEVDEAIEKEIIGFGSAMGREIGGMEAVVNILNEVDGTTEDSVLSWLEEEKAEMAEEIRQMMFVFEDLVNIDERGMRELLKAVDTQDLKVALKTASEEMKQKIFSNLSTRAGEMLKEDMEVMGPVRLAEVEEAQLKIVRSAKQMEAEGKIVLGKGKEDVLV